MENNHSSDTNLEYPGEWWTIPTESDNDRSDIIFVTGRCDIDKFRANPKFNIRVDVTYSYQGIHSGMPDAATADMLKEVTDRLVETFRRDPVAVLTGIYTGAGERNWVFYTLSVNIFNRKFNEALADLPTLPISMTATSDPDWLEYNEMHSILTA